MGLIEEITLAILKIFARLFSGGIIKGILPAALTLFFILLGIIFLSWAAIDILLLFFPSYQAKIILAIAFFALAAISKLRW